MKQFALSFILAICMISSMFAQITEGHAIYKMEMTSDDPQMSAMLGMMEGSKLEVMFKGEGTRTIMEMGPMMKMTTIKNPDSDKMLMLTDGMMGKKAILTDLAQINALNPEAEQDLEVEITDETRDIIGYKCKKAVMKTSDGGEITFWFTDKIKAEVSGQRFLSNKVPGFAMAIETSQQGMNMNFEVTSFEKKIDGNAKELFSVEVPEGYETTTLEALGKMGGM